MSLLKVIMQGKKCRVLARDYYVSKYFNESKEYSTFGMGKLGCRGVPGLFFNECSFIVRSKPKTHYLTMIMTGAPRIKFKLI